MKVCVTSSDKTLDAPLDPRFGRCRYFIIVDVETLEFEAVDNVAGAAMHGAGVQAAQTVVKRGVAAIITGNIGPNAYQVLSMAGIKIITRVTGTVKEVVEQYKRGELKATPGFTVPGHFGGGSGRGRGFGREIGRGLGRGKNMGAGASAPQIGLFQQLYPSQSEIIQKPKEELVALEEYKKKVEEDLEGLQARIKELRDSIETSSKKE